MITAEKLRTQTVKNLAAMAKREGVVGWHQMRKEQLVKALLKIAKDKVKKGGRNGSSSLLNDSAASQKRMSNGRFASTRNQVNPRSRARIEELKAKLVRAKDLAHQSVANETAPQKDRLLLMVQDAYWLHVYWELTSQSVERAQVALAQYWHSAKPILRLCSLGDGTTTAVDRITVRDIEIHGNVNHWYFDVGDPPRNYQVDIGYLTSQGRFYSLVRSNVVSTAISKRQLGSDRHWNTVGSHCDRVFALSGGYDGGQSSADLREVFEEKFRRPMGSPMVTRFGLGAEALSCDHSEFILEIDAEMILFGATEPGSHVTVKGEPIALEEDGTFTLRFPMPDRRQVLPVVSSSGDGIEQRTVILAVERNTKSMEPISHDSEE